MIINPSINTSSDRDLHLINPSLKVNYISSVQTPSHASSLTKGRFITSSYHDSGLGYYNPRQRTCLWLLPFRNQTVYQYHGQSYLGGRTVLEKQTSTTEWGNGEHPLASAFGSNDSSSNRPGSVNTGAPWFSRSWDSRTSKGFHDSPTCA